MNQSNWKVRYGINERGMRVSLALLPQDSSPQHWRLKYTGKGRGVALALESPKQNGSASSK